CFFFFQAEDGIRDRTVTGVQTCALPIFGEVLARMCSAAFGAVLRGVHGDDRLRDQVVELECLDQVRVPDQRTVRDFDIGDAAVEDRKSTRLNSSHRTISYAVFCLKKKKK